MKPEAPRRSSERIGGQRFCRGSGSDRDEEGLKCGDVGSQRSQCESSAPLIWSALTKIKRRLEKFVCF